MSYQTAAMQHHTDLDYTFVTAPHSATGPPDPGIATFYADFDYFEWFIKDEEYSSLSHSMDLLVEHLRDASPPYDGVMGFSQGAGMATRLAHKRSSDPTMHSLFRFVILIGGVPPIELEAFTPDIALPSLHITGAADPFLSRSTALEGLYRDEMRHALRHEEGHNIPSMRTELYPMINEWLKQFQREQ